MQITDVRVRKVTKEGKMRAVVSITIDDVPFTRKEVLSWSYFM